jgi:hypothetical protein
MEIGRPSSEAEAAQDNLLRAVATSAHAVAGYTLDRMLLETALKIRDARIDRLALSVDTSEIDNGRAFF